MTGPAATGHAAAFRAFDADPDAAVAVPHGQGGVFCLIGTSRAMDMILTG